MVVSNSATYNFIKDETAPSIGSIKTTDEWKKEHNITLPTISDSGSGVKTIAYCFGESSSYSDCRWTSISETSITANGKTKKYYVHIKATDNLDNTGYETSSSTFDFDNTEPSITATNPNNYTIYQTSHSINDISITDNDSGVDESSYCISDSSSYSGCGEDDWETFSDSTILVNKITGLYYVHIEAKDTIGNTAYWSSKQLYLDNTAPTIAFDNEYTTWQVGGIISVTIEDSNAGLKSIESSYKMGYEKGELDPTTKKEYTYTNTSKNQEKLFYDFSSSDIDNGIYLFESSR